MVIISSPGADYFATCATAEMCTAAADIVNHVLCNKQFGKSHSGSSLLTLLLVFSYDRCLEEGPKPDRITWWPALWDFKRRFLGQTLSETKPLHVQKCIRDPEGVIQKSPYYPLDVK